MWCNVVFNFVLQTHKYFGVYKSVFKGTKVYMRSKKESKEASRRLVN